MAKLTGHFAAPIPVPRPVPAPSPVLRKTAALFGKLPRALARSTAPQAAYASHPPIVVNSLPKSGTHLLMQVAEALPRARQYGSFIAQRPSWSARHRGQAEIDAHLKRIAPGEVIGAHLHHTAETAEALAKCNALHLFIYRDPRAVLVSEVQYLALTARWNALHKRFAQAGDFAAQVDLAIHGDGTEALPPVATRYGPYLAWRDQPDVVTIRYEDLSDPVRRHGVLCQIAEAYAAQTGQAPDPQVPRQLQASIRPWASHTYTGRDPERWRRKLSAGQAQRLGASFAWMG